MTTVTTQIMSIALGLMTLLVVIFMAQPFQSASEPTLPAKAVHFSQSSLAFVPNQGQTDPAVRFEARGLGGQLFFTPQEVILSLPVQETTGRPQRFSKPLRSYSYATLRLRFDGADPSPEISGGEPLPGRVSYFRGNDPAQWQTNLPTYTSVIYHHLYDGIALHYDGLEETLKGTFTVAPGVDPTQIRWQYVGAESVRLDETTGDLVITVAETGRWEDGEIDDVPQSPLSNRPLPLIEHAPVAWQTINGQRLPVSIRYDLAADGSVGFVMGDYDAAYPLIIDPTLAYSSYLGGSDFDQAHDIAIDSVGNVYVIGETSSANFPTQNPFQSETNGIRDVFVAKFDPNGARHYATYLGGENIDIGYGIAVDNAGNVYLTGETGIVSINQTPFPTTPGAYQTTYPGPVATFITKLNSDGSDLVYSTLFGGSGIGGMGLDLAIDGMGNTYVFGETRSTDLPLQNPAQDTYGGGIHDAFIAKFNSDGSDLVYSTYLGGSGDESSTILVGGGGIAVDSAGSAYVTNKTTSDDLPVTTNAFDKTFSGTSDAFVAKLSPAGDEFVYLTYLGGSDDIGLEEGLDITVDNVGQAYVTGYTRASDFPTRNPLQATNTGVDIFITKLNQTGNDLLYSTLYGGSFGADYGYGIALDDEGNIYVTGQASSINFPTKFALQPESGGAQDAFVLKLNPNGSRVIYSTYLGGEGSDGGHAIVADNADDEGRAYIVGKVDDTFPVQNAAQASYGGGFADGFVAKIGDVFFAVYLPLVIK